MDPKNDGLADFTVHFCGVSFWSCLDRDTKQPCSGTVSIFSEDEDFVGVDTPLPERRQLVHCGKAQPESAVGAPWPSVKAWEMSLRRWASVSSVQSERVGRALWSLDFWKFLRL